jgi:hypothetical protein
VRGIADGAGIGRLGYLLGQAAVGVTLDARKAIKLKGRARGIVPHKPLRIGGNYHILIKLFRNVTHFDVPFYVKYYLFK